MSKIKEIGKSGAGFLLSQELFSPSKNTNLKFFFQFQRRCDVTNPSIALTPKWQSIVTGVMLVALYFGGVKAHVHRERKRET